MTTTTASPVASTPLPSLHDSLIALVRLLARETARLDFAARCIEPQEVVANV